MKSRVAVGSLVRDFISSLAPEPRRKLWRSLKELEVGRGDIKQLDDKLYLCWRLRVNNVRVIFVQNSVRGERVLFCFFADYRATVYKIVEQIIADGFIDELKN